MGWWEGVSEKEASATWLWKREKVCVVYNSLTRHGMKCKNI